MNSQTRVHALTYGGRAVRQAGSHACHYVHVVVEEQASRTEHHRGFHTRVRMLTKGEGAAVRGNTSAVSDCGIDVYPTKTFG